MFQLHVQDVIPVCDKSWESFRRYVSIRLVVDQILNSPIATKTLTKLAWRLAIDRYDLKRPMCIPIDHFEVIGLS